MVYFLCYFLVFGLRNVYEFFFPHLEKSRKNIIPLILFDKGIFGNVQVKKQTYSL